MELKEVMNVMQVSGERIPSGYYKKPEVDAVIAEKDAEIAELQETNVIIANNAVRLNKDIAELKKKLEDAKATAYAESVDAGMREHRLKRALWLTRAMRAQEMRAFFNNARGPYWEYNVAVWEKIESKCRAKAEKYGEAK